MDLIKIGCIHSPFKDRKDAPRQGILSEENSVLEILPEYTGALAGLKKGSRIIVLYWGDRSDRGIVQSKTPWSDKMVGVFASRSPNRPNPIAICLCEIIEIDGQRITVMGLDALDGSPLLDIKIYSSELDSFK